MRKLFLLVLCFSGWALLAQRSVNEYQNVIVPSSFKFTSKADEYRLNTLTQLLLEKYGFKTYLDRDSIPTAVLNSRCENLYADVLSSGNFIRTKLQVVLKDCQGKTVYQSAIGSSKEKEYRVAYTQSLRQAFQSFESLHYQYQPQELNAKKEAVKPTAIDTISAKASGTLYAQAIANGFQLVDDSPKVVMKIFRTSHASTFTAIKGAVQGVLIAKNNEWFFEHYENDQLVSEKLDIKF